MEKYRLLAMTDGVVAIIITIMGEPAARNAREHVQWTCERGRTPRARASGRVSITSAVEMVAAMQGL